MLMGGRPQGFLSRVVAISSTPALSVCSAPPVTRLIFHPSACRLASYLALPATQADTCSYLSTRMRPPTMVAAHLAMGDAREDCKWRGWRCRSQVHGLMASTVHACAIERNI
mgnify:CR=1 FL=1